MNLARSKHILVMNLDVPGSSLLLPSSWPSWAQGAPLPFPCPHCKQCRSVLLGLFALYIGLVQGLCDLGGDPIEFQGVQVATPMCPWSPQCSACRGTSPLNIRLTLAGSPLILLEDRKATIELSVLVQVFIRRSDGPILNVLLLKAVSVHGNTLSRCHAQLAGSLAAGTGMSRGVDPLLSLLAGSRSKCPHVDCWWQAGAGAVPGQVRLCLGG